MKYIVNAKEIWVQGYEVEADSMEEAIEKVKDGEANVAEELFEYSHTLGADVWGVENMEGDILR